MQRLHSFAERRRGRSLGILCLLLGMAPAVAHAQTISDERIAAALQGLEDLARKTIEAGSVPGLAIAVVHNDKVVYLKGFGRREAGSRDLVDSDTVFQLASMSKPLSSTVVARLVSEGSVDWDSRICDLDPGFQLHDPYPTAEVTVRDLLNHRSGLPGSAGNDLEDIGFGRDEVLRRLRQVPAASSFRASYSYSNAGFTEGAVAAAKSTGKDWEMVAEEKLYQPLGMASTSSRHMDFLARTNRAALHVKADGVWTAKVKRDPDMQSPAGGASSSVRDLAQWMRLELGNGVLDGKQLIAAVAIAQTHAPLTARGMNPVTGAASFYGLGWNVEFGRHGLNWGHAGAFSVGARTLVSLYPKANLGIVVLTNAFPTGVPEGLADSFADLAFDGKIEKDWMKPWDNAYEELLGPAIAAAKAAYASPPAPRAAALPLEAYTGRYANGYVGDAIVSLQNGTLILTVGPGGARSYALQHFDRDLFLCFPSPETPDVPSAARFAIGPDGRATEIQIESLNDNGLGTLKRTGE
jgi:CubicO group peptidase (beta-lactamase class C family)